MFECEMGPPERGVEVGGFEVKTHLCEDTKAHGADGFVYLLPVAGSRGTPQWTAVI